MLAHEGFIDEKKLMQEVDSTDEECGYPLGLIALVLEDQAVSVQVMQTCEALTWGWIRDGANPKVITTLRATGLTSHQFKVSL